MQGRSFMLVLLLPVATVCAGCGVRDAAAKFEEQSKAWQEKFDQAKKEADEYKATLEKESAAWRDQVNDLKKSMVDATDKIDPLAIKTIYRDKERLSEIVQGLQEKLRQSSAVRGDLLLKDAKLKFKITRYKGEVVLRVRIDDRPEPLVTSQLKATQPVLAVDYNAAEVVFGELRNAARGNLPGAAALLDDRGKDNLATRIAEPQLGQRRGEIDARYRTIVTQAFNAFLQRGAYDTPQNQPSEFFLERQLQTAGRHEIHIAVDPRSPTWEVLVELFEVPGDGKPERRLRSLQINPETTKDPKTLQPMVVWVRYS